MNVEVALMVSVVSVAFSVFFGLRNNHRAEAKEVAERAQANAVINVKLDTISKSMEELKEQVSSLMGKVDSHSDRLTRVEADTERIRESIKRLHIRIDNIEERSNKEGKNDG